MAFLFRLAAAAGMVAGFDSLNYTPTFAYSLPSFPSCDFLLGLLLWERLRK